jgi:hypothetical protein
MSLIVVQPTGNLGHYEHTAECGLSRNVIDRFLQPSDREVLDRACGKNRMALWGFPLWKNGAGRTHWMKINPGDVGLFARANHFISCAEIVHKVQNDALAQQLWGKNEDGETWEYVYFLRVPTSIQISYDSFRKAASFTDGWVPSQTTVLTEVASIAVMNLVRLALVRAESQDVRNCLAVFGVHAALAAAS